MQTTAAPFEMVTVSVLIPVRNCPEHIDQAIASCRRQFSDHTPDAYGFSLRGQIIVFDDASEPPVEIKGDPIAVDGQTAPATDSGLVGTAAAPVPNRLNPHIFVELIRSETHVGDQVARNQLIKASSGEFIQLFDADDYMLAGKIAEQVRIMRLTGNPVSFTNFQVQDHINRRESGPPRPINTGAMTVLLSLLGYEPSMPLAGCWLYHRSVFDKVQCDTSDRYRGGMHDRKLTFDLLRAGFNPVHVNHPGYVHRCGWSGGQIGEGDRYLEARRNFHEDLFEFTDSLAARSFRRLEQAEKTYREKGAC